jgi:hypothetical protein
MSSAEIVLEELRVAREAVGVAERELDKAIADLARSPRAMKTTLSAALRQIFTALRDARTKLSELEETLDDDE